MAHKIVDRINVKNYFKEKFDCTKVTRIKYLKSKCAYRAECFKYKGNGQFEHFATEIVPQHLITEYDMQIKRLLQIGLMQKRI